MHHKSKTVVRRGYRESSQRTKQNKCVAERKNRKAAGANQIVNGFMKYDGEEMLTMMIKLHNWTWNNE